MKTKKQLNKEVVLSEATDGINKVRLMASTRAEEEEEYPWKEIDDYSGRFVVAGYRYNGSSSDAEAYHPWIAYSIDGGKTWTESKTTANEEQAHGQLYALTYAPDSYCWTFGQEKEEEEEEEEED